MSIQPSLGPLLYFPSLHALLKKSFTNIKLCKKSQIFAYPSPTWAEFSSSSLFFLDKSNEEIVFFLFTHSAKIVDETVNYVCQMRK